MFMKNIHILASVWADLHTFYALVKHFLSYFLPGCELDPGDVNKNEMLTLPFRSSWYWGNLNIHHTKYYNKVGLWRGLGGGRQPGPAVMGIEGRHLARRVVQRKGRALWLISIGIQLCRCSR